ncbi:unnamed protein product [Candidula unifasciata]|uniref:KIF-binding protein n=1 Tax=Candidula unifasciata TaxID=100452 RepID=A0A8S3ZCS5_9EUPU|nr:unnamed protein product [Candidula unifasciata]
MAALERFLGDDVAEIYKNAKFLSEQESKNDPEDEPYRSKYKARELYKEISSRIKDKLTGISNVDSEEFKTLLILSVGVDQIIGVNFMDTEELAEGEDYLMSCLKRIEENKLSQAVTLHISVLNHLGILWSQRGNLEKSMEFLTKAEQLYHNYKENVGDAPETLTELLEQVEGSDSERAHLRCVSFENTHTLTLYYLAQVYGKVDKSELSAKYCHMTLQRQLQAGNFNPIDWALNAATLSQYYLTAEKFQHARHCLASGSFIFESAKKNIEELCEQEEELQRQREADLDRCWIKYGLGLLEASRDKMLSELQENEDEDLEGNTKDGKENSASHNADKHSRKSSINGEGSPEQTDKDDKTFHQFPLELTLYEERITDKLVRTFDDARKIFLFVVDKINSAKQFYSLDSHASDAVEIIQDHSRAYKLLAFFELDMSRQCKMHKRRIDMLSSLLKELNPQYYLLVCRQIMFELAETYSDMVDLKITLIEMERTRATAYSTAKVNKLVQQSIEKYQEYVDSLKGGKPELPAEFPENDVRPALVAFFCMGRLYSKLLEPEIEKRIAAISKSLECYKFVVDYCEAHPSAADLLVNELSICKEMVSLLPLKMDRLREQC